MAQSVTPGEDYINSAVCASDILPRNAMGILESMSYDTKKPIDATSDPHAIIRNRSILGRAGGGGDRRIADFLVRLRLSHIPNENYRPLASILSLANCDESQLPLWNSKIGAKLWVFSSYTNASMSTGG